MLFNSYAFDIKKKQKILSSECYVGAKKQQGGLIVTRYNRNKPIVIATLHARTHTHSHTRAILNVCIYLIQNCKAHLRSMLRLHEMPSYFFIDTSTVTKFSHVRYRKVLTLIHLILKDKLTLLYFSYF